jgi:uncharacterized protein YodC (DUF2158 family)
MKPLTANDLVVGGKYVPHSKRDNRPYSFNDVIEEMKEKQVEYLVYKGKDECSHYFKASEWMNHVVFHPDELTPYHEPNQTTMNTEAKWNPETQSGTYPDKVHHGEMKVKPANTMNTDYTEQPFNLETALKHPEWVRTRDGREIDFFKDYSDKIGAFPIPYVTSCGQSDRVNTNGFSCSSFGHPNDLILRVPYREVWVNIYDHYNLFETQEQAGKAADNNRIACVPVKIPAI